MRIFILFLLFLPKLAFCGPCETAWKNSDAVQKVKVLCELEWSEGKGAHGVQLVQLKKDCAFADSSGTCAILRACGPGEEGDIGASVFRKNTPIDSYCLTGEEEEAFAPSDSQSLKVFITCSGVGKPTGLRLEGLQSSISKLCKFPFLKGQR